MPKIFYNSLGYRCARADFLLSHTVYHISHHLTSHHLSIIFDYYVTALFMFVQGGLSAPVNLLGDLSLKDGVKIKVNSRLIKKNPSPAGKEKSSSGGGIGGGFTLAPPPPPGSTVFSKPAEVKVNAEALLCDDDDDFGDFECA
jgi:hypothetical protein